MINKVCTKKVSTALMAAVLSLAAAPLWAEVGIQGYLIQATPFDHKMRSARAFYSFMPLSRPENSEGLFFKAKSIRYAPDEGSDYWQTPEQTEARWAGDCEDKAIWLYVQLKKSGYRDVRLVVGRYRSVDKNYHVWVTLGDDQGASLILDPSMQKRIWRSADFSEGFYRALYSFDGLNRYRHES